MNQRVTPSCLDRHLLVGLAPYSAKGWSRGLKILSRPAPRARIESEMNNIDSLRKHLVSLLTKGEAHIDLKSALRDFPADLRGRKPDGAPHTSWQLLEHMRIAQSDILAFSVDRNHVSPDWPDGYWPDKESPADEKAWDQSVSKFLADLDAVCGLVRDPARDLFANIANGTGQTLLREALLVADHNAYHLGQLLTVRQILEKK